MIHAFPLTLGDPALDQEHAQLQRLIEELLQASPAGAIEARPRLKAHAAIHFELEDEDLRRIGDPNATCHLDGPAAVLRSLDEVTAVLAGTPPRPVDLASRLATELLHWLPEHVQVMDAGIASARTHERFGGAPVQIKRR